MRSTTHSKYQHPGHRAGRLRWLVSGDRQPVIVSFKSLLGSRRNPGTGLPTPSIWLCLHSAAGRGPASTSNGCLQQQERPEKLARPMSMGGASWHLTYIISMILLNLLHQRVCALIYPSWNGNPGAAHPLGSFASSVCGTFHLYWSKGLPPIAITGRPEKRLDLLPAAGHRPMRYSTSYPVVMCALGRRLLSSCPGARRGGHFVGFGSCLIPSLSHVSDPPQHVEDRPSLCFVCCLSADSGCQR